MSNDDKLDHLLENVQLEEPDSDGSNNDSSENPSQVVLFTAVGSPTDEPSNYTSLALDEGSNGVRHLEEGLCQRPALSSIHAKDVDVLMFLHTNPQKLSKKSKN